MNNVLELILRFVTQFQILQGVGYILLFIAVCRLFFSYDRLFKYSFGFQKIGLQRLCRILLVIAFVWELWLIYQNPQIFISGYSPVVCGCLNVLVFVCGIWLALLVLDALWLLLVLIWNLICSFFGWIW